MASLAQEASKLQLPVTCDPPGEENLPQQKTWIVFGATGQMGRSIVRAALSHNDCVIAVGRTYETTPGQIKAWEQHPRCCGLICDVRIRESVEDVVKQSIERWGRVDVVANCTGYGIISPAEDQSSHDLHSQFATNVHGTLHILQTTIPYFRTQRIPGRYLIFSSTAGALGVPGLAPYCATKYAVEGLVESMLYEVHAFNIKATLVEPGFVRDDYPTASTNSSTRAAAMFEPELQSSHPTQTHRELLAGMHHQPKYAHFLVHPHPSPPYTHPTSPSMHSKRIFQWLDGRQPTSAVRCAELVWQLAHCRYPPLRLLLGTYAVDSVRDRLRCVTEEIEDWKFLSFGEGPGGGGADGGRSGGDEMEGVRSGENEEDFPTQVGVQQP